MYDAHALHTYRPLCTCRSVCKYLLCMRLNMHVYLYPCVLCHKCVFVRVLGQVCMSVHCVLVYKCVYCIFVQYLCVYACMCGWTHGPCVSLQLSVSSAYSLGHSRLVLGDGLLLAGRAFTFPSPGFTQSRGSLPSPPASPGSAVVPGGHLQPRLVLDTAFSGP